MNKPLVISHYSFLNQLFFKNPFLSLALARKVFVLLLSLFIVGYGQPARFAWSCPIAASVGFALFFCTVISFNSRKKIFWIASVWFALVQMIQLSWMTSIEFQGYYILAVYLFICCAIGAQFGLFSFLIPRMSIKFIHICALAAFWTLLEWSRLYFICGFSWNPTGLALAYHEIPMQFASVFGVFGLSFWVMLTNLWTVKLWQDRKMRWSSLCIWMAMIAAPYVFGILHINYHAAHEKSLSKNVRVALIQTGLLPSEKTSLPQKREAYIPPIGQWEKILDHLTAERGKRWDLIVLPEASLPTFADSPSLPFVRVRALLEKKFGIDVERFFPSVSLPYAEKKLIDGTEMVCVSNLFFTKVLANLYDAEVLIGLDHYDRQNDKCYNSAFLVASQSDVLQRYDKRVLLPLAEYLPYDWLLPLTKSYGIYEFFTQGTSSQPLGFKMPLSVSICYEETFSHLIRENAKSQCALMVNLTNDNYYPYSLLPEQHFTHARLRTVENGLPLLRSCNTGVTAVIDSLGRVIARFGDKGENAEFKRGVLDCTFVPFRYNTLFSLWGNMGIIAISCALLILYVLIVSKKNVKK